MKPSLRSRLARVSALITLLGTGACKKDAPAPAPASVASGTGVGAPARPASAPAPAAEFPPLPSQEELATTSGSIAISNLEGDVLNADKLLGAAPNNAELMLRVVPNFLAHAKTTGTLHEYDRALALAESAVKITPKVPQAWLTLSSVHSTLHRFDEALNDLKRAQALGAHGTAVDAARAGLLHAVGRFAEARPIYEKLATDAPRIDTLGALASLDADEGRIDDAERRFIEAQHAFSEVTPFPLVWLWFQQGLMWQKEGRLARARQLFAAAHERLPADVGVAGHLAGMYSATGDRPRAIALLRKVLLTADDPEYLGQLSQLLREDGDTKEADELRTRAATRYEALLKLHPAAYAEHAARFYLGPGADPKKALPLVKLNLERRKTPDAYMLALEAGPAAGEPAAATCQIAQRAVTPPAAAPARLRVLAARAFIACGQQDRADAELRAAASKPPAAAAATALNTAPSK